MNVYDEIQAKRDEAEAERGAIDLTGDWESLIVNTTRLAQSARVRTGNHDLTGWRERMVDVAELAVASIEWCDDRTARSESRT